MVNTNEDSDEWPLSARAGIVGTSQSYILPISLLFLMRMFMIAGFSM